MCITLICCSNTVTSGRWNGLRLAALQDSEMPVSIQTALQMWLNLSTFLQYRDTACRGPSCDPSCPDMLSLDESTSNNWPLWSKIVISSVVVGVVVVCVLGKAYFVYWLFLLEARQVKFLKSIGRSVENCSEV